MSLALGRWGLTFGIHRRRLEDPQPPRLGRVMYGGLRDFATLGTIEVTGAFLLERLGFSGSFTTDRT